jgi:predicted nucleic acid-binding protein
VALFDPQDGAHKRARATLRSIREPLVTTVAVLTEAFHLLDPGSQGSAALRAFVRGGGARVFELVDEQLWRAFELMETYGDQPMDMADASLVVAAESLRTTRVFTLDRTDFTVYRARIGRSLRGFRLVT